MKRTKSGHSNNSTQRGYGRRWRRARLTYLALHPLCKFHLDKGEVVAADVVDHITPHKGDRHLFWDINNWQSLCKECHDVIKSQMERTGRPQIGLDGWPIENKRDSVT